MFVYNSGNFGFHKVYKSRDKALDIVRWPKEACKSGKKAINSFTMEANII